MTIEEQKAHLRSEMKAQLRQMTTEEREEWSTHICQQLEKFVTDSTKVIGAFSPLPSEPNILPFLKAQQQKRTIALPRLEKESTKLHFYEVSNWQHLETDEYGILQPRPDVENEVKSVDLLIVPGLAFDKEGNRLGRSKGMYDRFLNSLSKETVTVGVCFPFQVQESLPLNEWDRKVDHVLF